MEFWAFYLLAPCLLAGLAASKDRYTCFCRPFMAAALWLFLCESLHRMAMAMAASTERCDGSLVLVPCPPGFWLGARCSDLSREGGSPARSRSWNRALASLACGKARGRSSRSRSRTEPLPWADTSSRWTGPGHPGLSILHAYASHVGSLSCSLARSFLRSCSCCASVLGSSSTRHARPEQSSSCLAAEFASAQPASQPPNPTHTAV